MTDEIVARHPQTEIHKLYGLTELSGRFCHMPHRDLMRNKSAAGRPLPGHQARISDPDSEGIGQIEARTPMMTRGYYLPGGVFEPVAAEWFATGDLGSIDKDGVVTVVGRADDVFKVGGEKVDRLSIESALAGLLKNRNYCVLPIEHHLFGLCPALFVEASPTQPAPTWADIVAFLRGRLPARFIPSLMFAVDGGLPRLPSGKIDRLALTTGRARTRRLP
jgi:O-succinylbenzoic acid--CoA ligase